MAKTIEARAVISAEDRTGGVFDKVAKKFDALAKSTKAAENVARLTNSLKDADGQLRAIDKFNKNRGLFADARARFRDAQVGIENASRAMAAAEKPTRAMETAYRRAQAAVSSASRAFEEQKVAVIGAKRALETGGIPISRVSSEQNRLRSHVERTTRALHQQKQIVEASPAAPVARRAAADRQADRHGGGGRPDKHGGTVLPMVGETGGLYGATRVTKHAIKEGAEMQHERVRMETAGMKPEEIESAEKEATHLSKKYLPVSQTQIMHLLRNTRSVVGSYHEASEIADPLLALRVVAMGAHPEKSDELNEDFDKLVKGMEIKGVTQDHGKFSHYIDNMAKAVNVFGDTLRPTDFYETFKYGRAATNALSDDFMLSTAPTLAQELGGSSAGKALSSFHTQFVGGKMSNRAVEQLQKYDMLDPKKIIKTKTGNVKGVLPGGIAGQEYLKPGQEDPYAWVNKVLIPKLAAKGVTDPAEIQEVISSMASQTTSAQMMSIFAGQQPRIEKDKALIKGAKGIDAAPTFMRNDPKIGVKSITTQADNILQNATSPAMKTAAPVLNSFAGSLAEIAEAAKEHPAASTAASAGALSGIMAGSAKGASWLLPMLFGNLPEGGIMKAIGGTAGSALKWGARGGGYTTAAMLAWEAFQNREEIGNNLVGKGEHATTDDPWKTAYDKTHRGDALDRERRERDNRRYYRMPIVNDAMTYDGPTGVGEKPNWASPAATSSSITVEGTVNGTAKIELTITAPDIIKVVDKAEALIHMAGQLHGQRPRQRRQIVARCRRAERRRAIGWAPLSDDDLHRKIILKVGSGSTSRNAIRSAEPDPTEGRWTAGLGYSCTAEMAGSKTRPMVRFASTVDADSHLIIIQHAPIFARPFECGRVRRARENRDRF